MSNVQFDINKDFFLQEGGWGLAQNQDIIKLLDSVVCDFIENIDLYH